MRFPKSSSQALHFPHRHFQTIFCLLLLYYLLIHKCIISNSSFSSPPLKSHSTLRPSSSLPSDSVSPPRGTPSDPLVTVILTAYNVRPFIDACINATTNQSYRNLQILVIDDASIDHTSERIATLTANDSRVTHIRFASNTFGGVAIPSNVGIDAAKGKYIAFVDGDDIPLPDFISKMVAVAEQSDADFTYCTFGLFENMSNTITKAYDLNSWPSPELIKLSQTHPFHPRLYPATFTLSPVPWRKLYRTDFLLRNNIRFPEGDYFFEDNSFHWVVNIHAEKIAFVPDTLVLHRVGRKSQTTSTLHSTREKDASADAGHTAGALTSKVTRTPEEEALITSLMGTQVMKNVPNGNYIGYRVAQCPKAKVDHCRFVRTAFLKWLVRSRWILSHVRAGGNQKIIAKATSVHERAVNYWLDRFDGRGIKGLEHETPKRTSNRNVTLSIVVPTYNVKPFLPEFVKMLKKISVKTEVIFVDDNSTDGTLGMLKEITDTHQGMYVLHAGGHGAGRARNFGMLFCEGDYVVFLDTDDIFRPVVLDSAVAYAIAEQSEVLMLKYEIEYVRNGKTDEGFEVTSSQGMFTADKKLWSEMKTAPKREIPPLAAKMTNYPWTKIVSRELLMRENIFFGPTIVNNDVQFHWHAIFAARSMNIFEGDALVRHRKFEERKTLTETKGTSRLELLDALAMTNRVLVDNGAGRNASFRDSWRQFSKNLIRWGRFRVGEEVRGKYERKAKDVMAIINSEGKRDLLLWQS